MTGTDAPGVPAGPGDLPPSVYRLMATVLRLGLVVALVILAGALVALLVQSPSSASGGWVSVNPLVRELDPRALGAGLAAGSPEAYLTVGVYALVATPVVRVVTGLYAFHRHGERRMVRLTAVVLVLLIVGLLGIGPFFR